MHLLHIRRQGEKDTFVLIFVIIGFELSLSTSSIQCRPKATNAIHRVSAHHPVLTLCTDPDCALIPAPQLRLQRMCQSCRAPASGTWDPTPA